MNAMQIKERGLEFEQLGKLPQDVLDFIYDQQLFKLFTAKELGGKDLDLVEGIKVFQQMSALDGNFGWLITIGTGGNAFIPTFSKEICEKIFTPKEAVIAGSGYPTGVAVKTDGGYYVTGQWKYCSGSNYATTFTMNSYIEEYGVKTENIVSCSVNPQDVEILHDWCAMGLKATASHTIRVNNVWVPQEDTFQLGTIRNDYGNSVHSFPFATFAEASFLSVCLGITESFLEEAFALMRQRNHDVSKAERIGALQFLLMQQQKRFKQFEEQFYTTLSEYWKKHQQGNQLIEDELLQFTQMSKEIAAACLDIVNKLIRSLGMDAITETSTINRIWRNLYTAAQHGFLTP
ncbi:acyl-CoA dehydrogenase [Lysinibacillus cavernae]|uniref:acyl-CoA dehydrogenase n=1 Tax=Lysinibacillus cavernae TaxID=2666135 RepID=UPI0012D97F14|nr:acyl-CoA dehydrogenase [Lysinibacillus cavernae]